MRRLETVAERRNRRFFVYASHETHLSAQPNQTQARSRLSRAYGDAGRAVDIETAAKEGPGAVDPLIGPRRRSRFPDLFRLRSYSAESSVSSSLVIASAPLSPPTGRSLEYPRRLRLLTAAQYRAVYRRGGRASAGPLRARMAANGLGHGRLGLSIGLKAAGSAVARNRMRRQVRESFRRHQHQLAGLDIVVSVPQARGGVVRGVGSALQRLWGVVAQATQARG